jgi:archaeal type IV pilus assembly protein PilA
VNTYLRKMKKNSKALSPVVASIILIAVTVAVSVVVAAWMGGTTIGLMGNAEQATVTNLGFSESGVIAITVQNTGNAQVQLNNIYVNTAAVTLKNGTLPVLDKGDTATLFATYSWSSSSDYTVKVSTAKGNNLVLTATAP